MKRKSTKTAFFFKKKIEEKKCDEKNCNEIGEYYAPKSPNSTEKYVFCLHHIKLYNKRWNYFAGKSQDEIYEFQKNDFFEGKPTTPFAIGSNSKIKFQFHFSFDKERIKFRKKTKKFENSLYFSSNEQVEKALIIFDLKPDASREQIKRKYKNLVKKYHPDVKNNIEDKEIKIKKINNAYKVLLKFAKN